MSSLKDERDYHRSPLSSGAKINGSGDANSAKSSNPKWRKVLYDSNSKFADNYTPHAYFLDAIERNKNLHKYSFKECLNGACQVGLQLNFVIMFYVGYFALEYNIIASIDILGIVSVICLSSYLFLYFVSGITLVGGIKRVLIFMTFGLGLSPLLHRLTDTIATDTIHTASSFMLLIHLIFHNYGLHSGGDNALSLNAGLFAAVCLASRLPDSFDGFVLLSLAVETFALMPIVRQRLKRTKTCFLLTLGLGIVSVCVSYLVLSQVVAWIAASAIISVVVMCPILFVHWQNYKDTIHGPWDEAVPKFL